MKKILISILSAGLFASCSSSDQSHNQTPVKTEEQAAPAELEHEQGHGLSLNNGVKWKADASTNANVGALKNILSLAKPAATEHFLATGKLLQAGLDKMIRECRMQGADHNALHQWLEPLMGQVQKLQEASSVEEAQTVYHEIETQIGLYDHYFE